MNVMIFNKTYTRRTYSQDSSFVDDEISIHLTPADYGSGNQWSEEKGIVRRLSGSGNVALKVADLNAGTKSDRIYYNECWYECVSSVYHGDTILSHYNYQFIAVPEEAIETITLFNPILDMETGYDSYIVTVINGVAWKEDLSTSDDNGLRLAKHCTIRIPEDADFSDKSYVEPSDFTGEDGTFTLRPGDVIVKGDNGTATSVSDVTDKYRKMVSIRSVIDNREAPNARHWRIEGV